MSKKVQKYSSTIKHAGMIPEQILQLGNVCIQAYIELGEKFNEKKHK
jgi:hypothetical protein